MFQRNNFQERNRFGRELNKQVNVAVFAKISVCTRTKKRHFRQMLFIGNTRNGFFYFVNRQHFSYLQAVNFFNIVSICAVVIVNNKRRQNF